MHKFYPQTCNRITIGLPTNFAVLRKMAMFSVQETLKVVKPPIVEIAQEFNIDATGIDKLITQWRNIVFIKWHCTSSTAKFWCEVLDYKDAADNKPLQGISHICNNVINITSFKCRHRACI